MLYAEIRRNRDLAYPWARWGAKTCLKLSGMKVSVSDRENLQENQLGISFGVFAEGTRAIPLDFPVKKKAHFILLSKQVLRLSRLPLKTQMF